MLDWFLDSASFMPHGYCLLWRPDLVAIHAGSDILTALSYFTIPLAIALVMRRRKDVPFGPLPTLFVGFILLCGLNHLVSVATMVYPVYGAQGFLKMAMALVSVATAIVIWPLVPRLVAIPGASELERRNKELETALQEKEALLTELTATRDTLAAREQLLVEMVESVSKGLVVHDADGREILSNAAYKALIQDEETAARLRAILDHRAQAAGADEAGPDEPCIFQAETAADGEQKITRQLVVSREISARGGALRFTELTDVTSEIETREALALSERRLWEAINAIPDGFVIFDKNDHLVVANQAYLRLHEPIADLLQPGAAFEDLIRAGVDAGLWGPDDGDVEEWIQRLLARRKTTAEFEKTLRPVNGRWLERRDHRLETGEVVGLRIDVTGHKEREAELRDARDAANSAVRAMEEANARSEHEALHDVLTGIANRRHLELFLSERIASPERERLAVLHIDLDRFKHVNDTVGHAAGDHVLGAVAEIIRECAGENDLATRIGGDEFILVARETRDVAALEALAQRIIDRVNEPIPFENHLCRIGASIGVAFLDDSIRSLSDLLANSDAALYNAKRRGKNRFEFYSEELKRHIRSVRKTADEIVEGLERGEFVAYYQPQLCAETMQVTGFEALARWRHPERGVLAPVDFLEIAENMGVSHAIDRAIYRAAVADLARWDAIGLGDLRASVNVSERRLRDPDLIRDLKSIDAPFDRLSFEMLESILFDDDNEVIAFNLDQLLELGVDIELDDFGSGHASIVGLTRLRPKRLKIDRRLIMPITTEPSARRLVKSIVDIGASLGVSVTAEGVETDAHIRVLLELGVHALQGYAIARPMPAAQVPDFIRQRRSLASSRVIGAGI